MTVHVKVWDDQDMTEAEAEHATVPAGDYFFLVTEPATEHVQVHPNGTHVITVKGRVPG